MNFYFIFALSTFVLAHATEAEDEGGSPYLLPLQRETVPVYQKGKIVSLKTTYSGKISIGSPASQEFSVVFDTGSGHVVLPSLACDSATCLAHRRYNITDSPKALPVNADGSTVPDDDLCDQATIGYGTGTVTGEFVDESVCLGPPQPEARSLKGLGKLQKKGNSMCTKMNLVVAVEMSAQPFESFKFDGIFGLGLESLALSSQFSFFSRFSDQSKQKARFGFFLSDGEHGEHSEIAMGGHNSDRLMGPLTWAPVASPKLGFWNIKIRSVRIGGVELADCKKGGCRGILDTGTSHLGVPAHHIQTVSDLLSRDVTGNTDCRSVDAPTLSIDINGFTITLGPEDYMQGLPSTAVTAASGEGQVATQEPRHCQPRVMPVNMKKPLGPNLFILGEPVLHRYYTVYDWHTKQVGFGLANSHRNRNRLSNGAASSAAAGATLRAEALDALEGDDEEIYLMQMSVSFSYESAPCEDSDLALNAGSHLTGNGDSVITWNAGSEFGGSDFSWSAL